MSIESIISRPKPDLDPNQVEGFVRFLERMSASKHTLEHLYLLSKNLAEPCCKVPEDKALSDRLGFDRGSAESHIAFVIHDYYRLKNESSNQ
jgi:hypothetical protein